MGSVRICVLGRTEARLGSQEIELGSRLQRTVLAVLAASTNEVVSTDRLIDELWGDTPPAKATHSLQTYVSNLRGILGPATILTKKPGYVLSLDEVELDSSEFADAVMRAGAAETSNESVEYLTRGLDLWRGARAFVDLRDSSHLVRQEATKLDELRLDAIEKLYATKLELGHTDISPSELQALCEENPYRESLHGLLMRALNSSSRQTEALRVYQGLRRRLADDLGIDPSPDLQDLELSILQQANTSPDSRFSPKGRLPHHLSPTVGRSDEIEALVSELAESRLVTVTGPAGVGKTRVAIEAARIVEETFADGVVFADLAAIDPGEDPAKVVVQAAGLPDAHGSTSTDVTAAFLRDRNLLLVLDNCEHVVEDLAGDVWKWATSGPQTTVLATSQVPLGLEGEQLILVAPLEFESEDSPAQQMFLAAVSRFGIGESQRDLEATRELCRLFDGLPLALEIAAGQMMTMTPKEFVSQLDTTDPLLTSSSKRAARYPNLGAALSSSFALLDRDSRHALLHLSLLRGAFTRGTAASLLDNNLPGTGHVGSVDELARRSLLQREERSGTSVYRILDTVRRFCRDILEDAGDITEAERSTASFFGSLAIEEARRVKSSRFEEGFLAIDENLDNFRGAFNWSLANGELELAFDLTRPMWALVYGGARKHILEGQEWRGRLERQTDDPRLKSRLLAEHAFASFLMGDQSAATSSARRSLDEAKVAGDSQPLALEVLALCAATNREVATAREYANQAMTLESEEFPAHGLEALAFAFIFGGDAQEAVAAVERVFDAADAADDPLRRIRALALMGAALQGVDLERSKKFLDEAVEMTGSLNMDWDLAGAVMARAITNLLSGNISGSLADLEWSSGLTYEMGDMRRLAQTLEALGAVLTDVHPSDSAARVLGAAHSIRRRASVIGSESQERRTEEATQRLRNELGEATFRSAFAEGTKLTMEQASTLGASAAIEARRGPLNPKTP